MTKRDAGLTRMLLDGNVKHEAGQQFLAGKGMAGERFPRVHRVGPHGFTSHPVAGGIATLLQAGGQRDSVYALGGENPAMVPKLPMGGTAIYDHLENIVSIVQADIRIVHSARIVLVAPEIVLDGLVKLGGEDADRPAAALGSIDSAGHSESTNLATMVLVK